MSNINIRLNLYNTENAEYPRLENCSVMAPQVSDWKNQGFRIAALRETEVNNGNI